MRRIVLSILILAALLLGACRSPLRDLRPEAGRPFALEAPPLQVEDHSRSLKRLRELQPGDANSPELRRQALDAYAAYADTAFRRRASTMGLLLQDQAPYRLELRVSTLGEVRTKYIVYGILSGVAWGVGTGLATHNTHLAVGLGAYELLEESLFWIAGSSLFGRYSAPVVLEASITARGALKPLWSESYYVIYGGARLKERSPELRKKREVQIQSSLDKALDKLFEDLRELPIGTGPEAAPHAAPGPTHR